MAEKNHVSMISYEREPWFGKLITNYFSGASKFCFLNGNVRDRVLLKAAGREAIAIETKASSYLEFYDIIDYLTWQLTEGIKSRFNAVICYSLTRGFYIRNSSNHSNNTDFFSNIGFNAPIIQVKPGEKYKEPQRPVLPGNDALQIIGQLLRQNQRIAVIIDHAEMIVPRNTFSNIHHEKLPFLEMLKDYSYDPAIYQSENLLILISENIADVETMLFQGQFVQDIMIDMPDKGKRLNYLMYLSALSAENTSEENFRKLPEIAENDFPGEHNGLDSLSRAMNGFTLSSIDTFIRRIQTYNIQKKTEGASRKKTINRKEVNLHRKKAIASDSAQLLQEVIPRGGFECVGGLAHIQEYFKDIAQKILDGQLNTVPKAILLAGPPGTGKSILAEALAKDARIPMVKMTNIRDKYVGESERKLELVLNTLLAWQPILVFIDEIDQVLGQRVTSQEQGSATKSEARMFGRLLEFLGDDKHRGKVVWIGATNRPDQMDDAMLRRFDRKFPVLLPYESNNRKKILEAFKDGTIKDLGYAEGLDLDEVATLMDGYTGSEMEQIIINAMSAQPQNSTPQTKKIVLNKDDIRDATDKFIASRNEDMYLLQSLLALDMCNHIDALPKPDSLPDSFREIVVGLTDLDRKKRQEAKRELQTEITRLRIKIAHN